MYIVEQSNAVTEETCITFAIFSVFNKKKYSENSRNMENKNKFQDKIFKMQCSGEVSILNRNNYSESSYKFYV